jgi:hypothetical protein
MVNMNWIEIAQYVIQWLILLLSALVCLQWKGAKMCLSVSLDLSCLRETPRELLNEFS